jgi:hypothetical protein
MPLKVPIRTHRAAIQGQEANARASVALTPLTCPSRLRDSQQGGEPAKPGDGGQWRVRVFFKPQIVPARRTPPAPGFRRGIRHHGAPAREPGLYRGPHPGPFPYGALRESVYSPPVGVLRCVQHPAISKRS